VAGAAFVVLSTGWYGHQTNKSTTQGKGSTFSSLTTRILRLMSWSHWPSQQRDQPTLQTRWHERQVPDEKRAKANFSSSRQRTNDNWCRTSQRGTHSWCRISQHIYGNRRSLFGDTSSAMAISNKSSTNQC
jgi:hypothetical protein